MRAHQAASSASSAREKWIRPLVVGPSPVMTPSRTMVRACAAVFRQEIFEVTAAVGSAEIPGAGIGTLLFFFSGLKHFHADVNEWLMDRHRKGVFFRWLPIGRCDLDHGSRGRNLVRQRWGTQAAKAGQRSF